MCIILRMLPLNGTVDEITRNLVIERLALYGGSRAKTAKSLGIGIRTLTLWVQKWKLKSPIMKGRKTMAEETVDQQVKSNTPKKALRTINLNSEQWREYKWFCPQTQALCKERFDLPDRVVFAVPGTTHRVVVKDKDGKEVAHVVPAPGFMGCVISWAAKDGHPLISE